MPTRYQITQPNLMIKALIFDFDGLILDTESPELRAWQEIFAEHGYELNLDLWADLVGPPRGYSTCRHDSLARL